MTGGQASCRTEGDDAFSEAPPLGSQCGPHSLSFPAPGAAGREGNPAGRPGARAHLERERKSGFPSRAAARRARNDNAGRGRCASRREWWGWTPGIVSGVKGRAGHSVKECQLCGILVMQHHSCPYLSDTASALYGIAMALQILGDLMALVVDDGGVQHRRCRPLTASMRQPPDLARRLDKPCSRL